MQILVRDLGRFFFSTRWQQLQRRCLIFGSTGVHHDFHLQPKCSTYLFIYLFFFSFFRFWVLARPFRQTAIKTLRTSINNLFHKKKKSSIQAHVSVEGYFASGGKKCSKFLHWRTSVLFPRQKYAASCRTHVEICGPYGCT